MNQNLNIRKTAARTCLAMVLGLAALSLTAQDERKLLVQTPPAYPELAKRLRIMGVVKVQVLIGSDGRIKETKVIGGHPVLVEAALEALKKWRYAPASGETTAMVEMNFHP